MADDDPLAGTPWRQQGGSAIDAVMAQWKWQRDQAVYVMARTSNLDATQAVSASVEAVKIPASPPEETEA